MDWFAFAGSPALQLLAQIGLIAGLSLFYGAVVRGTRGLILGAMMGGPFSTLVGGNLTLGMSVFFASFALSLLYDRWGHRLRRRVRSE